MWAENVLDVGFPEATELRITLTLQFEFGGFLALIS